MVINGFIYSGGRTLKSAVSHEELNGINWFLLCWYKFRKTLSYFNTWTPILRCVLQNDCYLSVRLPAVCLSVSSEFFSGIAHLIFESMVVNQNT